MSIAPLFPRVSLPSSMQALYPRGWFRVELGGLVLPGKAEISGLGIKLKKDAKEAKGKNGGRPSFHGLEAQEGACKVTVRTQEQLDELERVCALILPIPGSSYAGQPLSIASQQLIHLQCVTSVVVEGGTALVRTSTGDAEMTFQLFHWLQPQAAKSKGKAVSKTPKDNTRNLRTEAANARPGEGTVLARPGQGTVLAPSSDSSNWAP